MIFGYLRTSTRDQEASIQTQEDKLRAAGAEQVYIDRVSGKSKKDRPQLEAMLSSLRKGDQVISTKIDRLSRSVGDFIKINEHITEAGATLSCTDQHIETDTPAGRLMLNMLASFAEFEREMIVDRVKTGLDRAKAEGKTLGRPRIDYAKNPRVKALRTLVEQGATVSEAARSIGVSRMTAYRWMDAGRR